MTLFDEDQSLPEIDPNQNYLESLVGEGKKFKTPEELARGKAEADATVAKLIGELNTLRQEVTSRKRLEELVDQMSSLKPPPSPSTGHTEPQEPDEGKPQSVDVKKVIADALAEREREATRRQNLDTVKTALTEKLGPGYASVLKQQAPSLGMTTEELTELAAERPKAFLRLVGLESAPKPASGDLFTPPASSQQTFKPQTTERNYAWWEKLRKENKQEYWARQADMHKDAHRLGANFYS